MRVLVACEFSGIVRDAFRAKGHDAWSCDLLDTEHPGNHVKGNGLEILDYGWDIMIAHPPCTHLAVSGARWFKDKQKEQGEALEFVRTLLSADIKKIALENPISIISTRIRKPDQIIQPWMFGHGETKATCLWLKGLPLLRPTDVVAGRDNRVHREPPGKDRWKNRSRTFIGIAEAMASQWGSMFHTPPPPHSRRTNKWGTMTQLICRKCNKLFPSEDLVVRSKPARRWIPKGLTTPITYVDGVVSPCCWALWDEV